MRRTLNGVVDAVSEIAATEFPDLAFLDPNGVLELPQRLVSVERIRLELPSTEFLHLSSLLIDFDGAPDALENAERVASSAWPGYGKHLQKGYLFDPEFRGTGIHTRKEHRPWVELRFTEPVTVDRILLRNRDNNTALRARGIRVLVCTAEGRWCTVYDGGARERAFIADCEEIYGPVDGVMEDDDSDRPARASIGADLVRILTQLQLREYDASLVRELRQLKISEADKRRFRELVSKQVLFDRELEWTSHGIRRSFRFWTEPEKESYVEYAMDLVKDLRDLSENVCLGFGSVLAAVRDHDLIPHDDDLDIIMAFEPSQAATIADALRLLEEFLKARDYVVAGANTAHRLVSRPGIKKVDVFVGIFEGDNIAWFPGHRGALSREMIFPSQEIEFLGVKSAVPAEPEKYLEQIYGPSWSVPDPHFKHSGVRKEYADIIR